AEEDVDSLAVADRRGRGVAVLGEIVTELVLRQLGRHVGLPEDIALVAAQTNEVTAQIRHVAASLDAIAAVAGHEHTVADDNRAGRAGAGKFRVPNNVLSCAPTNRQTSV